MCIVNYGYCKLSIVERVATVLIQAVIIGIVKEAEGHSWPTVVAKCIFCELVSVAKELCFGAQSCRSGVPVP